MKRIAFLCIAPLLAHSLVFGQGQVNMINITGKVIDQDSIPIAGARVTLASTSAWTWSAEDGSFRIGPLRPDSTPVYRAHRLETQIRGLSVLNGYLRLPELSGQDQVRVGLYDVNGRKVRSLTRTATSMGSKGIDLNRDLVNGLARGAFVLRIEGGQVKMTLRALVTERGLQACGASAGSSESSSPALAKSLAAVDSLTVSHIGYVSRQHPVESYTGSNVLVSLISSHLDFTLKVGGLSARYRTTDDSVNLAWTPLDQTQFSFYRIYRTSTRNASGGPDMKTMISSGNRRVVTKNTSTFTDRPGLSNGAYYYCVRPAKIIGGDTALGVMSTPALVVVGTEVGLTINRGDLYTVTDKCSLIILDPSDTVRSVRFSQQYLQVLVKPTGEKTMVNFDDPANPPPSGVVQTLIAGGWLNSDGALNRAVVRRDVPDFTAPDPLNTVRAYPGMQGKVFPWTLRQGNGTKRVWAEVTLKSGRVDTLMDDIGIAPYNLSIKLANPGVTDPSVKVVQIVQETTFYLHRPWVDFTIDVSGDSTMSQDFDYWVMMPESIASVYEEIREGGSAVIETVPRRGALTGLGSAHSSLKQYRYMLNPDSSEGAANLARLRRTYQVQTTNLAFKLRDDDYGETMNRSCVPGSYWGPNPSVYSAFTKEVISKCDTLVPLSNAEKSSRLRTMKRDQLQTRGIKEFVIITRFTGRYFGDTRVAVSGGELMPGSYNSNRWYGTSSYFDWYPPNMHARKDAGIFVNNGDAITRPFSFAPAATPSFEDRGQSNITKIELVIARRPASMPWVVAVGSLCTADTLTTETLYSLRNTTIGFPIAKPAPSLNDVRWDNIDPSDWANGEYIMGVVAEDEYGNRGWAPIGAVMASQPYTNPWMVTKQ